MESLSLVIFGITSNLAQIKLIPVLYDMAEKDIIPEDMKIVGNARTPMTREEFHQYISGILHAQNKHHQHPINPQVVEKLLKKMYYIAGHLDNPEFYLELKESLAKFGSGNIIFYLATYPDLYHYIFQNLQKVGLNQQNRGFIRLMIEKPIGNNLQSAQELNHLLHQYFQENQIYRLDHYLGKETIQNILAFRFGNGIFEPLMNNTYVDHIQITAAEDFGIGKRGSYYDVVGALKDVGQNHQLQMLAFATMDAPSEFSNAAVTKERLKILKSLKPLPEKVVFGQYEDYRDEERVNPNSATDTFYALKTYIDNPRFKGVPIYIRAGKKMTQTVTEIAVVLKTPTNRLFKDLKCGMEPNVLIYRIQPNEGVVLSILTKTPGHALQLENSFMEFCYRLDPHSHYIPDPYERLIVDTIRGDQTFFNDAEEVEAQWKFIDPLAKQRSKPELYKPGSWGPKAAFDLIESDNRSWIEPSMDFCRI